MDEHDWLLEQFEEHRGHLRAVAYRVLGSLGEADDAVQEAWLRVSRADTSEVENLGGWLTTIVGRVCLNMLRSRRTRHEETLDVPAPFEARIPSREDGVDPEQEAVLADSVGLALLVVLDTLSPAERLAFVLHDLFAVPFVDIAPIVGRSPDAARQLASRARRRVHGADVRHEVDVTRQREVVDAFLAAARAGDFEALLAVLDPDVVFRADSAALGIGASQPEVRGAVAVARGAAAFSARADLARPALIDGAVGLVIAPQGRLAIALAFTVRGDRVVTMDVIADPEHLRGLDLAVLD